VTRTEQQTEVKNENEKQRCGLARCKEKSVRIRVATTGGKSYHRSRGLSALKQRDPGKVKRIATMGGLASSALRAKKKRKATNQMSEFELRVRQQ
jgi:hypothetical protein